MLNAFMAKEATDAVHDADAAHTASARAFLRKDYAVSLAETQRGLERLRSEATPTEPASVALERLLVLRITAYTAACLDERVKKNVTERLQTLKSSMPAAPAARALLDRSLPALVVALWYESLAWYGRKASNEPASVDEVPESLKPTPADLPCALQLPTQVLAAVVLMALRVDERTGTAREARQSRPSSLSRQMCEWYFDALLTPEGKAASALPPSYHKALSLYTVQVLGTLHQEWDYAHEVTGYSSLPDEGKWALLGEIDAAQARVQARTEQEQALAQQVKQRYEQAKARRNAAPAAARDGRQQSAGERIAEPASPQGPAFAPSAGAQDAATPLSGTSLRRTPSIRSRHGRPGAGVSGGASGTGTGAGRETGGKSNSLSHASSSERLQEFLHQHPAEPPSRLANARPHAPAPEAGVGAWLRSIAAHASQHQTRWAVAVVLLALLVVRLGLQRGGGRAGTHLGAPRTDRAASATTWRRFFAQRLWDTLRMGTQVTYL